MMLRISYAALPLLLALSACQPAVATYTAAEAQTRINEVFTGISEEMSDVGLAIQRAEDKTEQMKARAGAIDELMASGALNDALGGAPHDDIQAELDRLGAGGGVRAEAGRVKGGGSGGEGAGEPGRAGREGERAHAGARVCADRRQRWGRGGT